LQFSQSALGVFIVSTRIGFTWEKEAVEIIIASAEIRNGFIN
jgi:hypothetical protein